MIYFFRLLFCGLLLASLYFSLQSVPDNLPQISLSDKLIHAVGYFALLLSLDFSFRPGRSLLLKGGLVLVFSCAVEYMQAYIPGRESSIYDALANGFGILVFVACVPMLKRFNAYQKLSLT